MHAHAEQAKAELTTQVSARLQARAKETTEQFKTLVAWHGVGRHLNHALLRRLAHGVGRER